MTFTNPLALALLVALPYLVWLGRPVGRLGRGRAWTSLALRCLAVLLLILALAGTQVVRPADELAVAFLVDLSDSVSPAQQQAAEEWVAAAIQALRPGDKAAVIVFGGEALVDRPLSAWQQLAPVTSVPDSLNTDIDGAIRLGLALLPPSAARRLVILSDGIETAGDAVKAARLAAASGVQIDVFPLGTRPAGPEAILTSVDAPTRLTQQDRFDLNLTVHSNQAISALLRVFAEGSVIYEEPVSLAREENRFTIPLAAGQPGFARYRVQLDLSDAFYQNNTLAAYTEIAGPPRILVVRPPLQQDASGNALPDESDQLALALLASGMIVERIEAPRLPTDLATLSDYAAVVLVDVNAKHLSPRKMAALQTYVRDLGGGLVAVGGPESYAPGGYFRTPLEEALPVEMQLKDQERRVDLTMIFVIDKSGSMSDTSVGGIPKVELAKEAIIRSLALLGPLDRAGVVAFDDSAFWVIEPQEVADPQGMSDMVGSIRAGGGTDVYAGLLAVSRAIPDDPAKLKHVILLTDGGASETGNPELVQQMHDEYGVTLSVVAIGEGYAPWIERLPQIGQGRFHFAYDPDTIPEIFTQETTLATRAYIIEEVFWPQQVLAHPILEGISAAPPLYGYVGTSPKPAAQTILTTHQDDPLLAAWHYGLGKSVAWTSDATGRWATEWVAWGGFPVFWSQAVKWAVTQERGSNAEVEIRLQDRQAVLTVDAVGPDGRFLNGLSLEAHVVDPQNKVLTVPMQQTAPGRYQGRFRPTREGAYLIRVAGNAGDVSVAQTAGWVLGYSPEYQVTEPATDTLTYLAEVTGGGTLVEPWESLSHQVSAGPAFSPRRPIWHWLVLVAVILLPLDVAVRRLAIGRAEVVGAIDRLRSRVPSRRVAEPRPVGRSEQVGRLLRAKERVERSRRVPAPEPLARPAATAADERAGPVPSPPAPAPETESGGRTLAGQLLERKRKRGKERDD